MGTNNSHFGVKEVKDVWVEEFRSLQNGDKEVIGKSSIKSAANDLKALAKELKIPLSDVIQIYVGLNISRLCAIEYSNSCEMDRNIYSQSEVIRCGFNLMLDKADKVAQSIDLVREAIKDKKE
ncbi:hypothetical protein [Escherichia coli]|uniref:hypothetical protein n=1 Tax=Escherichia coli TaxID=562 RepID=UPI002FCD3C3D